MNRRLDTNGATLYTTVEPCSFYGRTPACAHSIISWGIQRVVVAIRDPHPRVSGAGINVLRSNGITVSEGVCRHQVEEYLSDWLVNYNKCGNESTDLISDVIQGRS